MWITTKKINKIAIEHTMKFIECQKKLKDAQPNGTACFNCSAFILDALDYGNCRDFGRKKMLSPEKDGTITVAVKYTKEICV